VKFGSAWPGENRDNRNCFYSRTKRKSQRNFLKNLSKIIHARVVEIVEQVFTEIKAYGHEDPKKLLVGIVPLAAS
jgi:cell division protein FtsA